MQVILNITIDAFSYLSGGAAGPTGGQVSSNTGTQSGNTGSISSSPQNNKMTTPAVAPTVLLGTPAAGWARTVIMIEAQTNPGQSVFIRGGIDHNHRPGKSTSLPKGLHDISLQDNKKIVPLG